MMRVTHTSGIQCDHFCCFCCPMGDRPETHAARIWPLPASQSTAAGSDPLASTGGSEHCSGQRSSGLYRRVRALQRAAILWPLPAGQSTAAGSDPLAPTGGSGHYSTPLASGPYRRVWALQHAASLWPLPAGQSTTARR